jgi:hypothetical protein
MRTSSLIGGMIWLALAIVAGTDAGFFQIIELMFLLAPLVVVPLGFHLLQTGKVWLQLPAALLAAISFAFLPGPLPLLLCVPWLAVTCLAAWDGWKRFSFEPARLCESAALLTLRIPSDSRNRSFCWWPCIFISRRSLRRSLPARSGD